MSHVRHRWSLFSVLWLLAMTPAWGAEEPAAPAGKPAAEKAAAKPAEGEAAETAPPPREQTIYVPFDKLRQTFEKDGRGVFIPYERFQELWKASRDRQHRPVDVKPPTPAVITEADSEATVGKEVVRVVARLKIDLLASGWVEVPLRLEDAGVISAQLVGADGALEPARLAVAAGQGYKLVVHNKTKAPQQIELRLEYAKAFHKTPGRNDVSFSAPQAAVNRWKVRIPEAGVKVHIEPLIAASEPPNGEKPAAGAKDGDKQDAPAKDAAKPATETVLLAFVGAAPTVRIDWTAKAEGASGLTALANVEAQQQVRVEEAALRTHAKLTYTISRAELSQLFVEVPADQKVVNVSATNVRQWAVETTGKTQKITIHLFEPARQSESIDIDLEQFFEQPAAAKAADVKPDAVKPDAKPDAKPAGAKPEDAARQTIDIPVVQALDVSRQQGVVVVDVAEGLQVEARTREGLLQLDPAESPPALAAGRHELSYRYAALPFKLSLDVTKVKPRVLVDEVVRAYLEPEQLTLQLQTIYTIERAGIFEMAVDVPAGYDVREVRGEAAGAAQPAQVDSHHLDGADKTRLTITLAHKALGCVGLYVELQKRLDDPNLLGPTGKSSEVPLPLPRVAPETIERVSGRLIVFAPESLRVNPARQSGLRSVSLAEALAGASMPPADRMAAAHPNSSFVYTKAPVDLSLLVERRKPYVAVGQLLVARVDPGVVKFAATFSYDIRYSGVSSLRIDLPADLAADVRNNSSGISERVIDPAPADLAPGDVAWSLTGEGELLGQVTVQLTWERRLENLEVGKSVELALPRLRPRNADRAWGQIVLVKAETIDLLPVGTPTGLRPIDPQHDLMPGASVPDAALAFEFHDDWSLGVTATRYQLEAVKHTSIERGLVRAVVTRGGQLAVQALYRMRSSRQRMAVELPRGVEFDTEPLRINGRPTSLERGAQDEFFVPLVGRTSNEPFLLELRYTLSGSGTRVDLPTFRDEPAVQKVFVSVFLPQELELLGHQGPWTDEQHSQDDSPFRSTATAHYSDPVLVDWVREGVSLPGNPADSFPVDGQPYVFSTLRPDTSGAGSLRLTTFNAKWLRGIVFAVVLALGLIFLRRPLAQFGAFLAALVILLLLLGAFLPTLAVQILFGGMWLALLLVLLMWLVLYLVARSRQPLPTTVPTSIVVPVTPAEHASDQPLAPPHASDEQGGDAHG